MNSEHDNEEREVLSNTEDLSAKLDNISNRLEIVTLTTNFMSNILSFYIVYRSISWLFR